MRARRSVHLTGWVSGVLLASAAIVACDVPPSGSGSGSGPAVKQQEAPVLQVGSFAAGNAYTDPVTGATTSGFPLFYMDDTGVAVDLPRPPIGDGLNAPTMIYDSPIPSNPYSVFLGFGTEAFYWMARAFPNTKYGKSSVTLGLEAAFVNGGAVPGEEMVFTRIRLKAPVRDIGTYRLFHPYGVETIPVTAADVTAKKGISFTADVGLVPRDFTLAANGPISRFLKQLSPPPPAGWIGDGTTLATVTGSPTGYNKVRLEGPAGTDLDGKGNNFVETTLFTVTGHIATKIPASLRVERATCSDIAGAGFIDVFAAASRLARVQLTSPYVAGYPTPFVLTGDGKGNFYGHAPENPANPHPAGPFAVTVTATMMLADGVTPDPAYAPYAANPNPSVVDNVRLLQADYSIGTQALTLRALSSDGSAVLTLLGYKTAAQSNLVFTGATGTTPMVLSPTSDPPLLIPPARVTVSSTMGGTDSVPISLVP